MLFLIIFVCGASFGSFIGLVIDRIPLGKSIIQPSSHCQSCQRVLKVIDLIPILSFFLSKARCRYCQVKLSWIYPILELTIGGLFTLTLSNKIDLLHFLTLIFCLILSILDIREHQFPLIIWIFFAIIFIVFFPSNLINYLWIILALLSEIRDLKIGSGDFLWLFIASFSLSFFELILLIQISSILGILYFLFKKPNEIPFIPFLSTGYLALLLWFQIH